MLCFLVSVLWMIEGNFGMELGRAGVYDSPMAQDYYVRRFGFLFGGGRSGLEGLQALQALQGKGLMQVQESEAPADSMVETMANYYSAVLSSREPSPPSQNAPSPPSSRPRKTLALAKEPFIVKLQPRIIGEEEPKMFYPYKAVP